MSDLGAAIARRARLLAAPQAAAYAAGNRIFTVTVTRPAGPPTFNRATASTEILPGAQIYAGAARIRPVATDGPIDILDELTYLTRAVISIDGSDETVRPREDDVVEVTAAPAELAAVVGRVFRVVGVNFGGHFPVGWLLTCTGVDPSPEQDEPGQ